MPSCVLGGSIGLGARGQEALSACAALQLLAVEWSFIIVFTEGDRRQHTLHKRKSETPARQFALAVPVLSSSHSQLQASCQEYLFTIAEHFVHLARFPL